MWQVLLAAAVAGSTGLIANRVFNPFSQKSSKEISTETDEAITPPRKLSFLESACESNHEKSDEVFRFSSSGSGDAHGLGRKNSGIRVRRLNRKGVSCSGRGKTEKRSGCGSEVSKRRFSVCLKKRKTNKNLATAEHGSSHHNDDSLFSWGLGVGIMYMMSAGKSEISKLNTAMDETAKAVQELKQELDRRKSLRNLSGHGYAVAENTNKSRRKDNANVPGVSTSDDGEYPSSVLTEEPELEPEMVEIDRLGTELESELQKLNITKQEVPETYQSGGIMPLELDNKLCHVLIERQEDQIEELESELHTAQSKLQQKETELQALKDCVKRLTDFSLSFSSDDEPESKQGQEDIADHCNQQNMSEPKPGKPIIGMKRPIHFQ